MAFGRNGVQNIIKVCFAVCLCTSCVCVCVCMSLSNQTDENRLLRLKNRNSPDVFRSFVTDLQNANEKWHSMDCDERSLD
jgi:hypothetical protein